MLGEGAFGSVWQATHRSSGEGFAIKIIEAVHAKRHGGLQAVMNEKAVLIQLDSPGHPRIIRLPATFRDANGDGSWTYPGVDGLLHTTRLVNIRDGIEDWSLLAAVPQPQRDALVAKLVRNGTDWSANATLLEAVRREAAAAAIAARAA